MRVRRLVRVFLAPLFYLVALPERQRGWDQEELSFLPWAPNEVAPTPLFAETVVLNLGPCVRHDLGVAHLLICDRPRPEERRR